MVNRFFYRFRKFVINNNYEKEGNFTECGGILGFEMKKDIYDWNCEIRILFVEEQYIRIYIEFCRVEKEQQTKELYEVLNSLNADAILERYFIRFRMLTSTINILPETLEYDWNEMFAIIDMIVNKMKDTSYSTINKILHPIEDEKVNKSYEDYDDDEEYDDGRFSRRELAEYYGYQYDEDYNFEQFLDDL